MSIIEENTQDGQQKISDENAQVLSNFFRCLTMLKKTLERLARQRWYSEKQYPEVYFEILSVICLVRTWAEDYKMFSGFQIFQDSLAIFITGIAEQVSILIEESQHSPGKKKIKTTLWQRQQATIQRSIKKMIDHLSEYSAQLKDFDTPISESIKKALAESFEKSCLKAHEHRRRQFSFPQRGEKSWIFPWEDPKKYPELVEDRNRFRHEVVEKLKEYKHGTGHKPGCKCR